MIERITTWAESRDDIHAVALVGEDADGRDLELLVRLVN